MEIIKKIILNDNIVPKVKVNILFLYSKMDPYFIIELKCLFNINVINNKKIDIELSEQLVNIFLYENIKLDKKVFDNLVFCLVNVVKNCELDEQLSNLF